MLRAVTDDAGGRVTRDVTLGAGVEFDLIRAMRHRWGALAVGLGDDAAVLEVPRGDKLVVSTDAAVENVHFRREWLSLSDIGYRAVTAALSDLAAMAATPRGVLVSITLTPVTQEGLMVVADGIADAVRAANTVVVGGNLARGDTLTITTTVIGSAFAPLGRAGAAPGDLLYVTGELGAPRAALRALQRGATPEPKLLQRFARPSARLRESRWLASRGASAAIDISDGLAGDVAHLAAAGGVGVEIQLERIPVFPGASNDDALAGGEEYELLVAGRVAFNEAEFASEFGVPLTPIGRVTDASSGVRLTRGGKLVAAPKGHDHFSD